MKWSDDSIFQLVEQYEKMNFCKIGIHFCSFSVGIICWLCVSWFLAPDNRRLKQTPVFSQCVISFRPPTPLDGAYCNARWSVRQKLNHVSSVQLRRSVRAFTDVYVVFTSLSVTCRTVLYRVCPCVLRRRRQIASVSWNANCWTPWTGSYAHRSVC